jgi:DNA-binding Lrp family transcriptional regulator
MRLSDFESAIIDALKLDAERPLKEIADSLGKSVSAVRSTLSKLEEQNTIRYYPFINIYALGYTNFLYYFTPVPSQEKKIVEILSDNDHVSWLSRFSGGYEYCASFVSTSPSRFREMLASIGKKYHVTCKFSCVQVQTALTMFSPKYLHAREPNLGHVSWAAESKSTEVDKLDVKILSGLVQRKYSSLRDLSRQIKVSHSTLAERVSRLVSRGVIKKFTYIHSPAQFGRTSYKVMVKSMTLHPRFKEELFEICRLHPLVTVFLECFGTWDFELSVEVREQAEVDRFVEGLRLHFGKLIDIVHVMKRQEKLKDACFPFNELLPAQ